MDKDVALVAGADGAERADGRSGIRELTSSAGHAVTHHYSNSRGAFKLSGNTCLEGVAYTCDHRAREFSCTRDAGDVVASFARASGEGVKGSNGNGVGPARCACSRAGYSRCAIHPGRAVGAGDAPHRSPLPGCVVRASRHRCSSARRAVKPVPGPDTIATPLANTQQDKTSHLH